MMPHQLERRFATASAEVFKQMCQLERYSELCMQKYGIFFLYSYRKQKKNEKKFIYNMTTTLPIDRWPWIFKWYSFYWNQFAFVITVFVNKFAFSEFSVQTIFHSFFLLENECAKWTKKKARCKCKSFLKSNDPQG